MGKRKKAQAFSEIFVCNDDDEKQPITESGKDIDASVHNMKKDMTKNDIMLVENRLEHTAPCLSVSVPQCKGSTCEGTNVSGERSKMDDGTFHFHLENIWRSFPEGKRAAFAHLDSTHFYKYHFKQTHSLEPIKRKDIFSKKYVFVPIVCWGHWRLVIFCHLGEAGRSKRRTRCILLLDSSEMCTNLFEPDLRKFVFDLFKAHDRPEDKDDIYRIPLLVPKVPQQTNDIDCGRFVLYFIKLFMDAAPKNFSRSNGYPYFMTPEWFNSNSFAKFCDKLDEESPALKQGIEQVPRRCSQRIRTSTSTSTSCTQKPSRQVEVILLDGSETSFEEEK